MDSASDILEVCVEQSPALGTLMMPSCLGLGQYNDMALEEVTLGRFVSMVMATAKVLCLV